MRKFTNDEARAIYNMLREECGATAFRENDFIRSATEEPPNREYRLNSDLGFGGKFRNNSNGVYVDCYPEDLNDERRNMLNKINKRLADMGYGRR